MIIDMNYYKKVGRRLLTFAFTIMLLYIAFKLSVFYIPFLIAFFVGIIWFAMKIEAGADILKMISSGKYFFEKYGVVLFGVAVLIMIVFYIASVKILERRRDI